MVVLLRETKEPKAGGGAGGHTGLNRCLEMSQWRRAMALRLGGDCADLGLFRNIWVVIQG